MRFLVWLAITSFQTVILVLVNTEFVSKALDDGLEVQDLTQMVENKGIAEFYEEYFHNMTTLTKNVDNATVLQ